MILDTIVSHKKVQVQEEKRRISIEHLISLMEKVGPARDFKEALNKDNISIIGEIKKASPSKGMISHNFDPENVARAYEVGNVDAISVLTETKFFKGNDEYISTTKNLTTKPVLRKDFIIDEYQIYQTKVIGADAVLLIVKSLGKDLKRFYDLAKNVGLHPLVEVHNRKELDTALEAGCEIIGINNRDLKTFTVNVQNTEDLIKHIPKEVTVISESGIKTPEDIKYLKTLGVNAVLVGEALMRILENGGNAKSFVSKAKGGL